LKHTYSDSSYMSLSSIFCRKIFLTSPLACKVKKHYKWQSQFFAQKIPQKIWYGGRNIAKLKSVPFSKLFLKTSVPSEIFSGYAPMYTPVAVDNNYKCLPPLAYEVYQPPISLQRHFVKFPCICHQLLVLVQIEQSKKIATFRIRKYNKIPQLLIVPGQIRHHR
jgi:hypothetical protein